MQQPIFSSQDIEQKLTEPQLAGWQYRDGFLQKNFRFKDFKQAMGFLVQTAMVSEALNHHANWSGVYNQIEIRLQTHDAKGITALDFDWAKAAEKIAQSLLV